MKWLLIITGFVALFLCLIVLIGSLLPRDHVVSRQIKLKQAARPIFATMRDFAATPTWRSNLLRVEFLPDRNGQVCFREIGRNSSVAYVVEDDQPPHRLVTRIVDEGLPFGGSWTFEVTPEGTGTRVRITERGFVRNPVFRFMARFVFGHSATAETYLRDLGRKFGEDVVAAP